MKAILLVVFFIISVNAKVLTYEVSTNYIMGDKFLSGFGTDSYHISLKTNSFSPNMTENPLVFKNISNQVLANIESVKTKVIVTKPIMGVDEFIKDSEESYQTKDDKEFFKFLTTK